MTQPAVGGAQTLAVPQFTPGGHCVAFQQSVDQAALAAINAVTDGVLTPQGATNLIIPAGFDHVKWGIAGGINLTDARLRAPSLDQSRGTYIFTPRKRGTNELLTLTAPEVWIPRNDIQLAVGENMQVFTSEDGAGATQQTALVNLGPAQLPAKPSGPSLVMRCTGTTTLGVRAWTAVPLTPDNNFPVGVYALVGVAPFSANALAVRVLFQGGGPRPGVPAINGTELGAGSDYVDVWRDLFGDYLFGYFTSQSLPQIEFFAIAADTAETVYLHCIRVG